MVKCTLFKGWTSGQKVKFLPCIESLKTRKIKREKGETKNESKLLHAKQNRPCFVVTIYHFMKVGFYFFHSLADAKDFIAKAKKELLPFAELKYNENGVTNEKILKAIKEVLSNDKICIGENGKTYFKHL